MDGFQDHPGVKEEFAGNLVKLLSLNNWQIVPYAELIWAVSLSILLYFLVKRTKALFDLPSESPDIKRPHKFLVYNLGILGVLGLSLFLVISVFITIPFLNQISMPSPYKAERLDASLRKFSRKDSIFRSAFTTLSIKPIKEESLKCLRTSRANWD